MNRDSIGMVSSALALSALLSALSTAAFAESSARLNNRLDNREANHEKRIEPGDPSGPSSRTDGRRIEPLDARLNSQAPAKEEGKVGAKVVPEEGGRLSPPTKQAGKKVERQKQGAAVPAR